MLGIQCKIKAVVLCGGQSSRMGTAKHKLQFSNGRPIYEYLVSQILQAVPTVEDICISVRSGDAHVDGPIPAVDGRPLRQVLDADSEPQIGPAAGLLAAYRHDVGAHWLVVACDYPLMSAIELRRLVASYTQPLTCFENKDGWAEPLLAIWSPEALDLLRDNVSKGITGPQRVVRSLQGKRIQPCDQRSLLNTNTPSEWRKALDMAREMTI